MDRTALANALRHLETANDVGRLFGLLGYQSDDRPDQDAQVVATWGSFQVLATGARAPQEAARRLARQLAATGRRGLAVAFDAAELAVAAPRWPGTSTSPLLVVPRTQPSALDLELLAGLTPRPQDHALAHALRVSELLSTERAGERFFHQFRAVLERLTASLAPRGSAADRRTVALVALTRVLFLYFVQAKGWLDGRPDYLRQLLDRALSQGRQFHRQVLAPLFVGTLNRPPHRRSARLHLGAVPYLNGGLFEPHPAERRLGAPGFPNQLWREAFDQLFERFRFCVREADQVNAIAPDMLGRVFERLMEPGQRHASGTFYTPEAVVRQLVDAALETALAGRLGPAAARRLLAGTPAPDDVQRAVPVLGSLRVFDPAAGSGAFLLGMLDRLTEIRSHLEPVPDAAARCRLRRAILRDNLFGADLSPIAVRLAELRLWLALVADDPAADIAAVAPLPNLDGILRQGDTLFDPLSAAKAWGLPGTASPRLARQVAETRTAIFQATGEQRARLVRHLRERELELARRLLADARAATDRALRDLAACAAGRDLFGRRSGLTPAQRQRYRLLRRSRTALRAAQRALADGVVPFFCSDVHLPEIALAGGFDLVVGNPPWVRAERLPPGTRRLLAQRFRWWRPAPGSRFGHLPDLSVAFLERSLELLRPGGVLALLLPSKLATAGYGEAARSDLIAETTIAYLHRLPDRAAAAFGATVYPLALVLAKAPPPTQHRLHLGFEQPEAVTQSALGPAGPWILVPDRTRQALERFLAAGLPLHQVAPPMLGVKTGADHLFVGRVQELRGELARICLDGTDELLETALLRPALAGRDLAPFQARPRHHLIWPYRDQHPAAALPPRAAAYFARHAAQLRRRADYAGGPLWTLFRTRAAQPGHRLVWPDLLRRPAAVVLDATPLATAVPLNTCYVAHAPDRATALALAAVLNSTWARAAALALGDEARAGYRRMNARLAGRMPVPAPAAANALADFSDQAHRAHHADQDQLDDAVAQALGLPPRDCDLLRRLAAHRS